MYQGSIRKDCLGPELGPPEDVLDPPSWDSWQGRAAGWALRLQYVGEVLAAGLSRGRMFRTSFAGGHLSRITRGLKGRCCIGSHLTDEETGVQKGRPPAWGHTQGKDGAGMEPGLI